MNNDKSQSVAAVDELQLQLRSFFTPLGFRRHGRTYNQLTNDGLTAVINFQMGAFDPPGTVEIPGLRENLYGKFTINLGIYVPEVAMLRQAVRTTRVVREYDCCLRTRLGHVGPERRDLWWPARSSREVFDDLRARLESDALSFLHRFDNRDSILAQLWRSTSSPYTTTPRIICAIILARRGDHQQARELLVAQADESENDNPRHALYVRQLARSLNL